jgi:DNA uptake protein ComE-like DNA-binding protein
MIFRMVFVRLITFAFTILLLSGSANLPVAAQTASAKAGKGADSKSAPAAELVDINHASQAELKSLPGIGEAYSLAIIKHRPYKNKTQLRSGGVIPEATYNKIRDKIIAKQ